MKIIKCILLFLFPLCLVAIPRIKTLESLYPDTIKTNKIVESKLLRLDSIELLSKFNELYEKYNLAEPFLEITKIPLNKEYNYIQFYSFDRKNVLYINIYFNYENEIQTDIILKNIGESKFENLLSKIKKLDKNYIDNKNARTLFFYKVFNKNASDNFVIFYPSKIYCSINQKCDSVPFSILSELSDILGIDTIGNSLSTTNAIVLSDYMKRTSLKEYSKDINVNLNNFVKGRLILYENLWRYYSSSFNNDLDKYLSLWIFLINKQMLNNSEEINFDILISNEYLKYLNKIDYSENLFYTLIHYKFSEKYGNSSDAKKYLSILKENGVNKYILKNYKKEKSKINENASK